MYLVVYENLLFFTLTVQAGGQDKIPKAQQKIHCLLFGLFKGSCVGVERQAGITMPCELPDRIELYSRNWNAQIISPAKLLVVYETIVYYDIALQEFFILGSKESITCLTPKR